MDIDSETIALELIMVAKGLSDVQIIFKSRFIPDLFAELHERHRLKIYEYLKKSVSNIETAHDLTSETFYQAFRSRRKYDTHKGEPIQWMYGISTNILYKYYRHQSVELKTLELIADSIYSSTHNNNEIDDIITSMQYEWLLDLIDNLPPSQRDALKLKFIHELDYHEIAELLNCSINTLYQRVFRGIERLRTHTRMNVVDGTL